MYGIFTLGNQIYGDSSKDKASYAYDSGTVSVLLDDTTQQLLSASDAAAQALQTASYIGGEIVAHVDANLIAAGRYDCKKLIRGCYGTTGAQHLAGSRFMRLDDAIFKIPITNPFRGETVSIKLQPFNHFGKGLADISQLVPHTFQISGNQSQQSQHGENVYVDLTGTSVAFPFGFAKIPGVSAYVVNGIAGDYVKTANLTPLGFTLRVLNDPSGSVDQFLTGGTATASSVNAGAGQAIAGLGYFWQANAMGPQWWQYDLGAGVSKVARRFISQRTWRGGEPPTTDGFNLLGSNTGAFAGEETILLPNFQGAPYTITTSIPAAGLVDVTTTVIDNDSAFRYYRFSWSSSAGYDALTCISLSDRCQRQARIINWTASV